MFQRNAAAQKRRRIIVEIVMQRKIAAITIVDDVPDP
jgi:hypothetical protein